MDIAFQVLLALHIMGLVMGLGGGMVNGLIGPSIGAASAETRPALWKLHHGVTRIATTGLILMLLTGPVMVWLKFDLATINPLFWVKMVLVGALVLLIIATVRAAGKAEKGDMAAAKSMSITGRASGLVAVLTVFIAVFAFS